LAEGRGVHREMGDLKETGGKILSLRTTTGYLIFGDYLNNFSQLLNSLTLFYEINEYNYHFKDYDSWLGR
jgi:hypothetical protein